MVKVEIVGQLETYNVVSAADITPYSILVPFAKNTRFGKFLRKINDKMAHLFDL